MSLDRQHINQLIAHNKIQECLNYLLAQSSDAKTLQDLSAKWNKLDREHKMGLIAYPEYMREMARIIVSIQSYVMDHQDHQTAEQPTQGRSDDDIEPGLG